MHFRPEAQRHFIAADGSRIICRERQEPASNVSVLRQAERLQRWPIDSRSKRQAIVGLERRRFGRDSGPDCVRRLDFSADVRRCDFFDQACC
jgi:hypothetical protein